MNELSNSIFQGLKTVKSNELGLLEFSTSIIFSISVGIICLLLYKLYFGQSFDRNESLPRSFMLIAPSVTAIFWAIQYSLPLSVGLNFLYRFFLSFLVNKFFLILVSGIFLVKLFSSRKKLGIKNDIPKNKNAKNICLYLLFKVFIKNF